MLLGLPLVNPVMQAVTRALVQVQANALDVILLPGNT